MSITDVTLVEKTKESDGVRAAVLDGLRRRPPRHARGSLRRRARGAARRGGLRGRAADRARRGRRDRRRDRRPRRDELARPHDGRYRVRTARRHARGDAHGARTRGPRRGGGDPGGCPVEDAARAPLARGRRPARRHAGRQPARARRGAAATASRCSGPRSSTASSSPPATRSATRPDMSTAALSLPRRFASLVKFEHTIFALPFAYVGAFLAVDGYPGTADLVWITLAMVGARTLAMALNRLVDAELDARNPRTAAARSRPGCCRALRCGRSVRRRARALPRRRLPARPDRALALADPGRRCSSSTRT